MLYLKKIFWRSLLGLAMVFLGPNQSQAALTPQECEVLESVLKRSSEQLDSVPMTEKYFLAKYTHFSWMIWMLSKDPDFYVPHVTPFPLPAETDLYRSMFQRAIHFVETEVTHSAVFNAEKTAMLVTLKQCIITDPDFFYYVLNPLIKSYEWKNLRDWLIQLLKIELESSPPLPSSHTAALSPEVTSFTPAPVAPFSTTIPPCATQSYLFPFSLIAPNEQPDLLDYIRRLQEEVTEVEVKHNPEKVRSLTQLLDLHHRYKKYIDFTWVYRGYLALAIHYPNAIEEQKYLLLEALLIELTHNIEPALRMKRIQYLNEIWKEDPVRIFRKINEGLFIADHIRYQASRWIAEYILDQHFFKSANRIVDQLNAENFSRLFKNSAEMANFLTALSDRSRNTYLEEIIKVNTAAAVPPEEVEKSSKQEKKSEPTLEPKPRKVKKKKPKLAPIPAITSILTTVGEADTVRSVSPVTVSVNIPISNFPVTIPVLATVPATTAASVPVSVSAPVPRSWLTRWRLETDQEHAARIEMAEALLDKLSLPQSYSERKLLYFDYEEQIENLNLRSSQNVIIQGLLQMRLIETYDGKENEVQRILAQRVIQLSLNKDLPEWHSVLLQLQANIFLGMSGSDRKTRLRTAERLLEKFKTLTPPVGDANEHFEKELLSRLNQDYLTAYSKYIKVAEAEMKIVESLANQRTKFTAEFPLIARVMNTFNKKQVKTYKKHPAWKLEILLVHATKISSHAARRAFLLEISNYAVKMDPADYLVGFFSYRLLFERIAAEDSYRNSSNLEVFEEFINDISKNLHRVSITDILKAHKFHNNINQEPYFDFLLALGNKLGDQKQKTDWHLHLLKLIYTHAKGDLLFEMEERILNQLSMNEKDIWGALFYRYKNDLKFMDRMEEICPASIWKDLNDEKFEKN